MHAFSRVSKKKNDSLRENFYFLGQATIAILLIIKQLLYLRKCKIILGGSSTYTQEFLEVRR
jgi:hypothetical protein